MRLTTFVVACVLLGLPAVAQAPPSPAETAARTARYEAALPQEPQRQATMRAAIDRALAEKDRPVEHRVRDERREVALILAAAAVRSGDHVLDVGAGGGYLSLLFSSLVGAKGDVTLQNTANWINQFPSMDPPAQKTHIKRANIKYMVADWDALTGADNTYDVIVIAQVYHDTILEGADVDAMNARLVKLLKPGGRLVVEDHEADPEMPIIQQVNLHRIASPAVKQLLETAGLHLVKTIAIPSKVDDKRFNVFRPNVRGRTERFVMVFEKPGSPL